MIKYKALNYIVIAIAAVLLKGCGKVDQSEITTTEKKSVDVTNKPPLNETIEEAAVQTTEIETSKANAEPLVPFWVAVREGNFEAMKLQLNVQNLNSKDEYDLVPLHYAANFGYMKIIDLLIGEGADINVPANNGWTPIDWAGPDKESVSLLRKHGGKTGEELKTKE
tara:strand:+ start:1949 stop:2449 length:501 start_codon:yes stop_codon:yes gene_type:complete